MYKSIAIYPYNNGEEYIEKCDEYLALASKYCFNEVFTSVHLPELDMDTQMNFLFILAKLAKKYNMEITADIGGGYIKKLIANKELFDKLNDAKIDFLRLDYGYDHKDIEYISKNLYVKGFVINASIYTEEESKTEIEFIRSLNKEVRSCHNFYPRVESGIDSELALHQKKIFDELHVPIYYCIPSLNNPRGPIFEGLPTLEEHRYKDLVTVSLELINKYDAQAIMFADNFYSEKDFSEFNDVINHKTIKIKAKTYTSDYDDVVFKEHKFRYDSSNSFLRSQSSRQMAEFSKSIAPDNCVERKIGSITIDNTLYERYSGELQVVLKDSLENKKINVVGFVDSNDIEKLYYFRYGYTYLFVK